MREGGLPLSTPTRDEALAKAARLLEFAEDETDLAKMERYTEMANSWLSIASVIAGETPDVG